MIEINGIVTTFVRCKEGTGRVIVETDVTVAQIVNELIVVYVI